MWISARAVGMPGVEHELLGERLGGLDLGGGAGRSEDGQAGGAEAVDDAGRERRFGADDGEVDGAVAARALERVDVERVIGTHSPSSAMPGIARRGDELERRARRG